MSGILSVWETKVMYDFSQKAIVFEKDGVRIIGGSYKEYQYIPWEKISYGNTAQKKVPDTAKCDIINLWINR